MFILDILLEVIYFIVMVVIIIGGYILAKKYVYDRFKINKFIPLVISFLILGAQIILKQQSQILSSILTIIAVLFFGWFWDIQQGSGSNKKNSNNKNIKIKPKAKPNRVKKNK